MRLEIDLGKSCTSKMNCMHTDKNSWESEEMCLKEANIELKMYIIDGGGDGIRPKKKDTERN